MHETSMPIIKFVVIMDECDRTWGSLTIAAPKIIGVDSRNENFAAPSLVISANNPVVIVMPERDTPGIIART
jgi:hypothetical protein